MKKLLLIAVAMLSGGMLKAQTDFCASEGVNRQYLQEHPEAAARMRAFDIELSQGVQNGRISQRNLVDGVYEIPVVVHIFHTGGAEGTANNPSDQQVMDWINGSNAIYAATAEGYTNSQVVPIKMVLAQRDPDCMPTNGILRINGNSIGGYAQYGLRNNSTSGATQNQLKGVSRWSPDFYYNIYVVNTIDNGSNIQGFAYYPNVGSALDSAYMIASIVNGSDSVLTHEMGHALGLRHVFDGANSNGDECPVNSNCAVDNDAVCDTAPVMSMLSTTPTPNSTMFNTCSQANFNGEQYNIMNYGYNRDRFTTGQANRAVAHLFEFRSSLLGSMGATAPEENPEETEPIAFACYPGSANLQTGSFNMGPTEVVFGGIDNVTAARQTDASDFYYDYTEFSCLSFNSATTVPFNAPTSLSVAISAGPQNIRVYMDYNNDGEFSETDELILSQDQVTANTSVTTSITHPQDAVTDVPLRMRVISDASAYAISACTAPRQGQTEDYQVTLSTTMLVTSPTAVLNIVAYPNPFDDSLTVTSQSAIQNISIADINGRQVFSKNYSDKEVQANLSALAKGIYILKVVSNNTSYTKKIIRK